jgi:hypothetical protein
LPSRTFITIHDMCNMSITAVFGLTDGLLAGRRTAE